MLELRNSAHYTLLAEQFRMDESDPFYQLINDSLKRFFDFIYHYTDLVFIDFIDESTIYEYIRYHKKTGFKHVSFQQVIKDVKAFLFFLKYIKNKKHVPPVDLSLKNYSLWARL